jgi:glutathione S-transferase
MDETMERLILHEDRISGNCYKIRLTAALLGMPLERRQYDVLKAETRTTEFLTRINPNGRIPVLQIGDKFLPESNAACWYLASRSPLVPDDRFEQADVLRWMFFEQYNHEPNVATIRFWKAFVGYDNLNESQRMLLPGKEAAGEAALKLMDEHLAAHDWFVGRHPTLADICLYAYTHVAEEGGFELVAYPAVQAWLARVAEQPGYVGMAN